MLEILVEQNDVISYYNDIEPFIKACQNDHLPIAKRLLQFSSKVKPAARNNEAICWAIQNNHLKTVKFLYSFNMVHPAVQNSDIIIQAKRCDHHEVAKFLLSISSFILKISALIKAQGESW